MSWRFREVLKRPLAVTDLNEGDDMHINKKSETLLFDSTSRAKNELDELSNKLNERLVTCKFIGRASGIQE